MAELVSGNPSAICGEAASGTALLPLQGDAFAWKFQVPVGAEMTQSYELETTDGLQRVTLRKTEGEEPRLVLSHTAYCIFVMMFFLHLRRLRHRIEGSVCSQFAFWAEVLKVCYCEKQSIGGNQFQICSQAESCRLS